VARLLAPGVHFLSIVVTHWVVFSVAYRLALFIACCTVFVIAYRLVFLVAYRPVFASRIVTLQLISTLDHHVSYRSYNLQLWTGPLGIRRSPELVRRIKFDVGASQNLRPYSRARAIFAARLRFIPAILRSPKANGSAESNCRKTDNSVYGRQVRESVPPPN